MDADLLDVTVTGRLEGRAAAEQGHDRGAVVEHERAVLARVHAARHDQLALAAVDEDVDVVLGRDAEAVVVACDEVDPVGDVAELFIFRRTADHRHEDTGDETDCNEHRVRLAHSFHLFRATRGGIKRSVATSLEQGESGR